MIRGLQAAAAGMAAQLRRQEVYANNLANAATVGYRRAEATVGSFDRALDAARQSGAAGLPGSDSTAVDLSPGPVHETGAPFDLALVGPGLFVLQTDRGLRYTRDGRFSPDAEGKLRSLGGHQVMGREGPIELPGADFAVTESGQVLSDGKPVAALFIAEFDEDATLTREPDGLFKADRGPRSSEQTTVKQGFLEEANVSVVRELTAMMSSFRAFEASAVALRLNDQTVGVLIDRTSG